jgi:hypothetical protein
MGFGRVICLSDLDNILAYYLYKTTLLYKYYYIIIKGIAIKDWIIVQYCYIIIKSIAIKYGITIQYCNIIIKSIAIKTKILSRSERHITRPKGRVICLSDLGNILAYYLDKTTLISLLYWVSNCSNMNFRDVPLLTLLLNLP